MTTSFKELDDLPSPLEEEKPKDKKKNLIKHTSLKGSSQRATKIIKRRLAKLNEEATREKKKLAAVRATTKIIEGTAKTNIVQEDALDVIPDMMRKELEDREIIFVPNPGPQTEFLAASENQVFYGGARGGGKSYSLVINPLRYCNFKEHRAVIIRKSMPELREMIWHSQQIYPKAFPGATWREKESAWRMPSGARVEFGYAENMTDLLRYQGQAYSEIDIDELPQYESPEVITLLQGSLRTTNPNIPEQMRFTGNPGNIGSAWVKEMFIDPAPHNTTFRVPVKLSDGRIKHITRRFIPAKLSDNPYLTQTDSYLTMLSSLPETKRRQWLEGDWDAFDGAAFPEFDRKTHVVEPFTLSPNWPRFRACDWGYSSPACCLWFAVGPDNELIVYREFYTKGLTADVFATEVLTKEARERIQYGVLDMSTWAKRGDVGPSIAETMIKMGCRWRPSDRSSHSRVNGKLEVHRRLSISPETKKPKLFIFNTCTNLIRTLPMLPIDPNDPEDVDTRAEDHAYDALRYGVASRPVDRMGWGTITEIKRVAAYTPVDNKFGY